MQVSVAYAEPDHQEWVEFEAPEGITAEEAVRMSGILEKFPHLELEGKKLGVFGKPVKDDQELREGDRVEIYRPLQADPKKARTRKRKSAEGGEEDKGDAGGDGSGSTGEGE
ncbi:hypothetical protein AN478_00830 [Thiohalorhabdus denitrificans]|uniref:UPF0125 protein SAMN05661077_2505 n=1 Tax=Thiohalorhabdus denitrificans TaxID=381306 RepID=A0A0N8PNJ0_9GAMM|nr:RnfH family protein [Thiohalorhabdus denitrificans]KPV41661.1 hypothetical protein AN478_00830 [Thiohalorhabdus denitrificans]SCY56251.1 hypothetical protein SAMN05661077_2505 [Thiohalorhabdus denitrificans]